MSEQVYGNRYFRKLTDKELFEWRPKAERGWLGWFSFVDCANVRAANREMRRRAKTNGLQSAYDWVKKIAVDYKA